MANKIRAEVTWEWDDEEYTLKLTNNDLLSLESALDASAGEILSRITESGYSVRDCMQILQRALMSGARMSRKDALAVCGDVPLMEMVPICLETLMAGYGLKDTSDDDDKEVEPKPKKKGKTTQDPF